MPPKKKKEQEKAPVDESFQSVDITTREPRTVLLMLASPEPGVVTKALQALNQHMQKSEQNCRETAELGVVASLVGLLSHSAKAIRSYAAVGLSLMTTSADVRKQVCKADGLPPLLSLLKPEEEPVTVECGTAILAHMTTEYSTKVKLLSLGAHRQLLPLITGADPDTQKHALSAVTRLVELHRARQALAEERGMSYLLEQLTSEYPAIQQLALQALVSCMHDVECRERLREADGLTRLVSFLGNKEVSDLHLLAVTVLSLCLHDSDNMTALQTSGLLDQLLSQVADASANTDMRRQAAIALAKTARDEVNRKILHEQDIEKTFIQLLTSSDDGVVCAALEGLGTMCALSSGRARVGQEGGVVGVVSCAGREGEVKAAAAQCLAHISTESPANCKMIQEAEGCPVLVALLTDSQTASLSGAAATTSNMASIPLARDELIAADVVPALVACLEVTEVRVQRSAADALAILGTDAAARLQFLSSGGVVPLLPLLLSRHTPLLTSVLRLIRTCTQTLEVAQEFCAKGALQLLTQLSQKSYAPSAIDPALRQLLNSDLSAKWWTKGHLDASDVVTDIEFFDAGPALSKSQPFTPLSDLIAAPLHMNRPILTANLLLLREAPPTSVETTPTLAIVDPSLSQSRSKSRLNAKSRKGREVDSRVSDSSHEEQLQTVQSDRSSEEGVKGGGVLRVDHGLQSHITHTLTHITPLPTLTQQAIALASYVCNSMGGEITSGKMTSDLHQSQLQREEGSNVVALGDITMGTYRHRTLLYKILADQMGLPCTLTRGEYGRQWNAVTIVTDGQHVQCYVVDLVSVGGRLLETGSPEAHHYCHI